MKRQLFKMVLIIFLFSCNKKMVVKYGQDGKIIYRTSPKHQVVKDILSDGDTLYTNTKAGIMLRLKKNGDTVIVFKDGKLKTN